MGGIPQWKRRDDWSSMVTDRWRMLLCRRITDRKIPSSQGQMKIFTRLTDGYDKRISESFGLDPARNPRAYKDTIPRYCRHCAMASVLKKTEFDPSFHLRIFQGSFQRDGCNTFLIRSWDDNYLLKVYLSLLH